MKSDTKYNFKWNYLVDKALGRSNQSKNSNLAVCRFMSKKYIKLLSAIVLIAGFTTSIMAQATVNSTAGVNILTPLSISEAFSMNFGTIGVQNETGGTVVITTTGVRSATDGVTLSGLAPFFSLATFIVTGEPLYTYSITLPGTITITLADNSTSMTISSLLAKSASGIESNSATGTLLADTGSESFTVGGTLTVEAAQLAGLYSGTFSVTVAYN
jgi:hypothetical protein